MLWRGFGMAFGHVFLEALLYSVCVYMHDIHVQVATMLYGTIVLMQISLSLMQGTCALRVVHRVMR